MSRMLTIVVAGIVGAAIAATMAPAGQEAVTPKQLAALTKRVKASRRSWR